MAVLTRFCFCCGLRAGCMFVATYSLLSSAFFIALLLIRNIGYRIVESSIIHAVVTYGSFVLFGLLMLVSVGLIIGVHRESRWMFIPWLVQTLVALLFATGTIVWLIVTIIRSDQGLESWEIALVTFHSINLICSTYCMLCVISLFQDLSKREPSTRPTHRERRANMSTAENGAVNQGATASNGVPRPPALSVVTPPPYADKPPPYTTFPRGAPQLTSASGQQPPAAGTAAGTAAPPAEEAVPGEDDLPPYSTFPRGVPDQLVAGTSGTRANGLQAEPGHEDLGDAPPYSTFPRGVPPELLGQSTEIRPRSIHPPPLIEEEEEEEGEGELREEEAEEGGEREQEGGGEDVLEPQQVEEEEEVSEREVRQEEGEEEGEVSDQEEVEEHQEEDLEDIHEQQQGGVPPCPEVGLTVPSEAGAEDGPLQQSDSCGQDVLLVPELGTASYSGRSSGSSVSAIQISTDNPYGGPLENDLQPLLPASSDGDTDTDTGKPCDEDAVTTIYATPVKKSSTISTEDSHCLPDISTAQESAMPPESPSSEPPPVPQKLFAEAESVAAPKLVSQNQEPPVSSSDQAKAVRQRQEEVPTGHMLSPPPTLGPASSRREAEIREIKQRLRRVGALPKESHDSLVHGEKVQSPLPAEVMQQMGSKSTSDTKKVTARMEVAAVNINHERSSPAAPSNSHMPQQHSPHVQRTDISQRSPSKASKHERPIMSSRADSTSISAPALSPAIKAQLEVVLDRGRRLNQSKMRVKGAPTETRSGPLPAASNVNWEKYNTELKNRAQKQLPAVSSAGWSPKNESARPGHPGDTQERARTTENRRLMAENSNDNGDPKRTPQQQERRQRGLPRAQLEGPDNPQYNTDPLPNGQELSPEGRRRQNDTRDERSREGRYVKPFGKSRDRPRSDDRDRHRPDERDRIRSDERDGPRLDERDRIRPEERDRARSDERDRIERDRPRPDERDRIRPDEKDRLRPDERDRLRPDERDRPRFDERDRIRPDERDRIRPDERDRIRPDERDRPRPDERDRIRPDERDRIRPDERDRIRPDERDRIRPDERDRIRSDERDKLRQNDRERQKLGDKDRMWLEDRDKAWPEDRDFIHPNGTAYNVHRQLQPPEYIPHAKRLSRENNDPYWENWKYAGNRGVGGSPRLDMNSKHRGKRRVYSERQEGDSKYHMQNLHDHYK